MRVTVKVETDFDPAHYGVDSACDAQHIARAQAIAILKEQNEDSRISCEWGDAPTVYPVAVLRTIADIARNTIRPNGDPGVCGVLLDIEGIARGAADAIEDGEKGA